VFALSGTRNRSGPLKPSSAGGVPLVHSAESEADVQRSEGGAVPTKAFDVACSFEPRAVWGRDPSSGPAKGHSFHRTKGWQPWSGNGAGTLIQRHEASRQGQGQGLRIGVTASLSRCHAPRLVPRLVE